MMRRLVESHGNRVSPSVAKIAVRCLHALVNDVIDEYITLVGVCLVRLMLFSLHRQNTNRILPEQQLAEEVDIDAQSCARTVASLGEIASLAAEAQRNRSGRDAKSAGPLQEVETPPDDVAMDVDQEEAEVPKEPASLAGSANDSAERAARYAQLQSALRNVFVDRVKPRLIQVDSATADSGMSFAECDLAADDTSVLQMPHKRWTDKADLPDKVRARLYAIKAFGKWLCTLRSRQPDDVAERSLCDGIELLESICRSGPKAQLARRSLGMGATGRSPLDQ